MKGEKSSSTARPVQLTENFNDLDDSFFTSDFFNNFGAGEFGTNWSFESNRNKASF